jgi:hypothetical protein
MLARGLAAVVVAGLLAGCARPSTSARSDGSRDLLTQAQLAATNSETVFDAITKLRPEWLTSRGPTSVSDPSPTAVSVYMNGTMLGKADFLRDVRLLDVTEVRYWNAGQASAKFGMGHPRGVIEITRK